MNVLKERSCVPEPARRMAVDAQAVTSVAEGRSSAQALPACTSRSGLRHHVPILLALALVAFLLGHVLSYSSVHLLHHARFFLQGVNALLLGARLLLVPGVLLLSNRQLPAASRSRVLVDVLMSTVAAATFSWYFIVGPEVFRPHASTAAVMLHVSYSLLDLALIFCLMVLTSHFREEALRRVLPALAAGLILIVAADSARDYLSVHSDTSALQLLSAVRWVGFAMVGVGAVAAYFARARLADVGTPLPPALSGTSTALPSVWRYLLPYLLIPAVVALMVYAAQSPQDGMIEKGVFIAGVALIELVFVHQLLAYRELIAYTNRSARLESLAAADPITALPNHRTMVATLDGEVDRSRRYGHSCTVLFLDLDRFKSLNDTYGHRAGDAALREFASVVRTALRGSDILGRWGGEEFVALLVETDRETGCSVAARARASIAGHAFRAIGGGHITCSIGVATYPEHAADRDHLVEYADQAMYTAKRLGRNQVRTADDPLVAAEEVVDR